MREIVGPYKDHKDPKVHRAWRQAMSRIDVAEAERAQGLGNYWGAAGAHLRSFAWWPERRTARAVAADVIAACRRAG